MAEYEWKTTEYGGIGVMPSWEEREFVSEEEYSEAYEDEVNEIVDALYDLNNGYHMEDDYNGDMQYA